MSSQEQEIKPVCLDIHNVTSAQVFSGRNFPWLLLYVILSTISVLSPQVDKGVVPLAGTNGETTTQGKVL